MRDGGRPAGRSIMSAPTLMDRAFTVAAPPAAVWPWLVQLGKKRAGWYLPRAIERFLPRQAPGGARHLPGLAAPRALAM